MQGMHFVSIFLPVLYFSGSEGHNIATDQVTLWSQAEIKQHKSAQECIGLRSSSGILALTKTNNIHSFSNVRATEVLILPLTTKSV